MKTESKIKFASKKEKASFMQKVTKAAWTIFKRDLVSFREAMVSAWAWAIKKFSKTEKPAQKMVSISHLKPKKETEKAIIFEIVLACIKTDQEVRRTVCLPKSQIVNGEIPTWLATAKENELLETINYPETYIEFCW